MCVCVCVGGGGRRRGVSVLCECVDGGHPESHVDLVENEHLKAMLWMSEG